MNILVGGSNSPGALERSCAVALQDLGHDVVFHDRQQRIYARSRFQQTPVLSELESYPLWAAYNYTLLQHVRRIRPDLLFVVKGVEISPRTLSAIRHASPKTRLVNWNPDSPFDYATANTNPRLRASIPLYDICFIWDTDLFQPLWDAGARRVEYLPFAYDRDVHLPVNMNEEGIRDLSSDVCFVGGYTAERAGYLEHIAPHVNVKVWGTGWEKLSPTSPLRNRIQGGWADAQFSAKCFGAAKVTANFIREQNGQAHNMRTFEAPAMGGFMLSTRTRDQQKWLPEDVGAAYYADKDEFLEKVRYYIAHNEEREQIRRKGFELITSGRHTYHDRMQSLITAVRQL